MPSLCPSDRTFSYKATLMDHSKHDYFLANHSVCLVEEVDAENQQKNTESRRQDGSRTGQVVAVAVASAAASFTF